MMEATREHSGSKIQPSRALTCVRQRYLSHFLALDANIICMIRTFKCKETENIFRRRRSSKLPADIQRIIMRKLTALNAAPSINTLRVPPVNRLEALGGDREGQHSIRINNQWRICFRWHEGNAYDVEIADYH
jgi:proteic killer suppression protein